MVHKKEKNKKTSAQTLTHNNKFFTSIINMIKKIDDKNWEHYLKNTGQAFNPITGNVYSGINSLVCHLDAIVNNRTSSMYSTFKAISSKGGKIKKGAKSLPIMAYNIIYYTEKNKKITKEEKDKLLTEGKKCKARCFVNYYNVFNFDDVENLNINEFKDLSFDVKNIELCDNLVKDLVDEKGLKINYLDEATNAFYNISKDVVFIPSMSFFKNEPHYYSTLFHEIVHWSGHSERLNRNLDYASEELVAELGAMLCSEKFKIGCFNNSVKYLKNWLRSSPNELHDELLAAAFYKANEAVKFILKE